MAKTVRPRRGSMQYWPRKRAAREYPRIRSWPVLKDLKPLGFAGYKVGMTHVILTDPRKNSKTKGKNISWPVTIVECPPLKVASARFYKKERNCMVIKKEAMLKSDKDLSKKFSHKKDNTSILNEIKAEDYDEIRLAVYTQPRLTTIGKKKPELFELALGGSVEEQLNFAKERLGKEIKVEEVFAQGSQVDVKSVTKGKGTQGSVKRFGVTIRSRKSEKTKRGPANLGSWGMKGKRSWTVPHPGQMGYHTRTDYNKFLLKISDKPQEVNKDGGFIRYGNVKNSFILIKGSIPGPSKRLIRFNYPIRPNKKFNHDAPEIIEISLRSQQGN